MELKHLNSINELAQLRKFLGRNSPDRGSLMLVDSITKERYVLGGQKYGGGSNVSIDSKDYIVGRFLQETLDKEIMCKISDILREATQMIDNYMATLGVTVNKDIK